MVADPILAIDTSGAMASVAVYAGRVLAEITWRSGRRHSAELLPTIEAALRLGGLGKGDLAALAVATGPGSYSGLRVGVATAMALGLGLGIGVVQVPTLEVIAWEQLSTNGRRCSVRAAIDVGRGRYASARYRGEADGLVQETPIESATAQELASLARGEGSLLAIDLDVEARAALVLTDGAAPGLAAPAASARRAGFLAELAAGR